MKCCLPRVSALIFDNSAVFGTLYWAKLHHLCSCHRPRTLVHSLQLSWHAVNSRLGISPWKQGTDTTRLLKSSRENHFFLRRQSALQSLLLVSFWTRNNLNVLNYAYKWNNCNCSSFPCIFTLWLLKSNSQYGIAVREMKSACLRYIPLQEMPLTLHKLIISFTAMTR